MQARHRDSAGEVRALKDRAHVLLQKNKVEKALACFQEISAHMPDDLSAQLKQGDLLRKLGRDDEAVATFERVAERYAESHQLLKALATCRLILDIDGDNRDALNLLARLYAAREGQASPTAELAGLVQPCDQPGDQPDVADTTSLELVPEAGAVETERPVSFPLFSDLPEHAFVELAAQLDTRRYKSGDVIARVGEAAESLFMIAEGSVRISKPVRDGEVVVAHLTDGDFFGEVALLAGTRRTSTIVAEEPTVLFEIKRTLLDEIVASFSSVEQVLVRCYLERRLQNLSRTSALFDQLALEERAQFLEHFTMLSVKAGEDILTEGQTPDGLYILLAGHAVVSQRHAGKWIVIAQLDDGDTFGEISLLEGRPVNNRVRTSQDSMVLFLPKPIFDDLAGCNDAFVEYLRALADGRRSEAEAALDEIAVVRVRDVMTKSVHTVTPEASIKRCTDVMRTEEISCVVVCAGDRPVDIVTERDLVSILGLGLDTKTLAMVAPHDFIPERELMVVAGETSVEQALAMMLANRVRRVPVVNGLGNLIGVITQTNLLEHCATVLHQVMTADHALDSALIEAGTLGVEMPTVLRCIQSAQRALRQA